MEFHVMSRGLQMQCLRFVSIEASPNNLVGSLSQFTGFGLTLDKKLV